MSQNKEQALTAISMALNIAKTINTASKEDSYKLGEVIGYLLALKIHIEHS